ncbi:3-phytase A [Pyricularia oryzae 70-15]|uniref:Phytase A n=3 Tax=Pyricularia oryzae TaxID=318829 RepID=G5EH20_PYRO7|nr:3-phytase A [Pyricularia oryzae 70-15]EAQ70614.1 hypothetical protein MGCH7_ch7g21 [Pyricularia oryzae 70-15]EHA46753.1 3-phytase A [Pyricularia oryzae 70-15]ELQ33932.1 3-phytase A [Pyricularia oryzae Y34]KAI7912147.1 3-phytase A [Pyricularia oryzae]
MLFNSIFLSFISLAIVANAQVSVFDAPARGFQFKAAITHNWGQYAPFFVAPSAPSDYDSSATLPGCSITFAQVLQRHGARYPTAQTGRKFSNTIHRLQTSRTGSGVLNNYIKNYKYNLGVEELNDLGRRQTENSGYYFYQRYQNLARRNEPFIRYDDKKRVFDSAELWAKGFHRASITDKGRARPETFPYKAVALPHGHGFNNTLNNKACPKFEKSYSKKFEKEVVDTIMAGLIQRINSDFQGAGLTGQDVVNLMGLCTMETTANFEKTGQLSPLCNLFTEADWVKYGYLSSVQKWYRYGNGNPLGPTMGVGWVNELIARLTRSPVQDQTSTNTTLDRNPETFPLQGKLYADFSHTDDMIGIYAALGLFNAPASGTTKIPTNKIATPKELGGFSSSLVSPMGARMYVEKMICTGHKEELVRVLINERVMTLSNCGADRMGRCTLSKFILSLDFARNGGRWDQCFANI